MKLFIAFTKQEIDPLDELERIAKERDGRAQDPPLHRAPVDPTQSATPLRGGPLGAVAVVPDQSQAGNAPRRAG